MTQKRYVSWNELHDLVNDIAHQIEESGIQFDYIVGVARGGLVPAVLLSHRLEIPLVCAEYSTRDNMTLNNGIKWLAQIDNALVVDDIADSGATIDAFKKVNEELKFATVFHKTHTSSHDPDFVGEATESDDWIVFPFEKST